MARGLTIHQDFLKHNGFGITLGHYEVLKSRGACLCGRVLRDIEAVHHVTANRGPLKPVPGSDRYKTRKSLSNRPFCDCCASDALRTEQAILQDLTTTGSASGWTSRGSLRNHRSATCAGCACTLPPGVGLWRHCVEPTPRGGGYLNARISACVRCAGAYQRRVVAFLATEVANRHPVACHACELRPKVPRGFEPTEFNVGHRFRLNLTNEQLHSYGFCLGDDHPGQACPHPSFLAAFEQGSDGVLRASIVDSHRLSGYGRRRFYQLIKQRNSEISDWVACEMMRRTVGA
jgi:hypothetical protein